MNFDVVVMGGGPAGSTTALCLARLGRRVALCESRGFEEHRYGETLPPETTPLLKRLGLWDAFLATGPIESPGIVSVWGNTDPYEQDFIRNVHGCGWHVDRARFDEMLFRRAGVEGATLFPNTRADAIQANFTVDACGASELREVDDVMLAVAVHLSPATNDQRSLIESVPDGWWYSSPLPNEKMIAMFFTDPETYHQGFSLADQLEHAHLTRARIGAVRIEKTKVLRIVSGIRHKIAHDSWLAVGDSAASHDPLSGFGVFEAIRRGEEAAIAISAELNGDPSGIASYVAEVQRSYAAYAVERKRFYRGETRWPDHGFWQRR